MVLGVDKVETDEVKGTLAVTGTADPFDIVKRTRKAIACAGKVVDVVTIGPPPKPEEKKPDDKKPDNKKPDDKKPDDKKPDPPPVCPCPPYPLIMDRPTSSCLVKPILLALFFNRKYKLFEKC